MQFSVTILGNASAFPTPDRFPTSQVIQIQDHAFLIDAGEGMQIQLQKYYNKTNKIERVFISHLHGDHYFGIFGWLGSLTLSGRTAPLHIHAPLGLEEIIKTQMRCSGFKLEYLPYELHFHTIENQDKSELIFENKTLEVRTIPLQHSMPCSGFLFREKPFPRKMNKDKIDEYQIHFSNIKNIKSGADYTTPEGKIIPNKELTIDPPLPRSYAFCTDTGYIESIIPYIKNVDLLYHESTFTEEEKESINAEFPTHCTAKQAAEMAKKANVRKLLLGHFSPRYRDLNVFQEEARQVFAESYVGEQGVTFEVERRFL